MGVVAHWSSKTQILFESTIPGPGELPVRFLETWETNKSLKAITNSFSLLELPFWTKLLNGRL
jgi:hypothetical protein